MARPSKYFFNVLNVGDYAYFDLSLKTKVRGALQQWKRRHPEMVFRTTLEAVEDRGEYLKVERYEDRVQAEEDPPF